LASLALALGLGMTGAAVADGGAGASATASKAKGTKGKGKKRSCKGKKGKAKRKRKTRGGGGSKLPLRVGTYEGQEGISLRVKSGGKRAALIYTGLGSTKATCLGVALEFPDEPAKSTAKSFKAGGKTVTLFGGHATARWVIEVTPKLKYKLTLDSTLTFPEQPPCDMPGVRFNGTLKKTG
jgi:hypothetical protein